MGLIILIVYLIVGALVTANISSGVRRGRERQDKEVWHVPQDNIVCVILTLGWLPILVVYFIMQKRVEANE